jgi:hypothetical protein
MRVKDQFHAPASFPPGDGDRILIDMVLVGPHNRSGGPERSEIFPLPAIEPDPSVVHAVA